jgi:hypothetical protein
MDGLSNRKRKALFFSQSIEFAETKEESYTYLKTPSVRHTPLAILPICTCSLSLSSDPFWIKQALPTYQPNLSNILLPLPIHPKTSFSLSPTALLHPRIDKTCSSTISSSTHYPPPCILCGGPGVFVSLNSTSSPMPP